jgi:mono/diheme cytochrome c family protein
MKPNRHPGGRRDLVRQARRSRREIPAFAGISLVGALLLAGGAALAQAPPPPPKPTTLASRPNATGGEALYVEHCMHCHGPNGMGTGLLARRIEPVLLEARDNLPAQYVIVAARQGIGNMPPVPRGEVSDAELRQIAEYLAAGPLEAAR